MECMGNTFCKEFEESLVSRAFEGSEALDIIGKIDPVVEKILMDAGRPDIDLDALYRLIGDHQETVYLQGVKDGARIQLHLLDMAPDTGKEASQ